MACTLTVALDEGNERNGGEQGIIVGILRGCPDSVCGLKWSADGNVEVDNEAIYKVR